MRVGTENTTFAVLGVESDVTVPLELTEGKKFPNIVSFWLTLRRTATERCTTTIDSTVPDDSASWYELWQAAVTVDRDVRKAKGRLEKRDCLVSFHVKRCGNYWKTGS